MNRSDAAREVKTRYAEYLQPAKKRIAGKPTYICPICGNGTGKDGDGMSIDPHGDGTQLKCFKCGFYGDIVDLYQQQNNCDVGAAFTALYDRFGITIDKNDHVERPQTAANEAQRVNIPPAQESAAEGLTEATEGKPDFTDYLDKLSEAARFKILSFADLKKALSVRMDYFASKGCCVSDHGLDFVMYNPASDAEVEEIFAKRLKGEAVSFEEELKFKTAFMLEMGRQCHKRSWVMQLHYGCKRNNNTRMFERLGPDTGYDCINTETSSVGLANFLNALEREGNLRRGQRLHDRHGGSGRREERRNRDNHQQL